MSATVDSGNETLFSDSSSCDLVSPAAMRLSNDPDLTPDPDLDPDPDLVTPVSLRERIERADFEDLRRRSRSIEPEFEIDRAEEKCLPPKIQPYSGVLEKVT